MPALDRNVKFSCENCGTSVMKQHLSRHLLKYRYRGKILARCENVSDKVQMAISSNQKFSGVDKKANSAKKGSCEISLNAFYECSPKSKRKQSTRTSGSVFAERIGKAKKTKLELELIKFVDCFLIGRGNYESKLVSFKIKSSKQTLFFVTVSKSNESSQRIQITC